MHVALVVHAPAAPTRPQPTVRDAPGDMAVLFSAPVACVLHQLARGTCAVHTCSVYGPGGASAGSFWLTDSRKGAPAARGQGTASHRLEE